MVKKISILPDRPIFSIACEVKGEDKLTAEEKRLVTEYLDKYLK